MIIKVGDKVRLKHIRKVGFVVDYINDKLLKIDIEGDAVPVFLEDLEFISEGVELPQIIAPRSREIRNTSIYDEENRGFYVVFLPLRDKQDNITDLHIFIVNNSDHFFLLDFTFKLGSRDVYRCKKEAVPSHIYPLNKIDLDRLNESPSIELKMWLRKKVEGKQQKFSRLIKVKPQTFFKTYKVAPLMDEAEGFVYEVFRELPDAIEPIELADVKEYIQEWKGRQQQIKDGVHQVLLKAETPHEIDLHIERLVKDHSRMSNREILKIQLDRGRKFLEQAIMSGLDRVYLIHGLGKGKLRMEIEDMLEDFPHVRSYNNNYHHKYGYGATEVEIE